MSPALDLRGPVRAIMRPPLPIIAVPGEPIPATAILLETGQPLLAEDGAILTTET